MGYWHVKKALGRGVLSIRGCVLIVEVPLLTIPTIQPITFLPITKTPSYSSVMFRSFIFVN
jgi:hypothetical protein